MVPMIGRRAVSEFCVVSTLATSRRAIYLISTGREGWKRPTSSGKALAGGLDDFVAKDDLELLGDLGDKAGRRLGRDNAGQEKRRRNRTDGEQHVDFEESWS